MTFYVDQDVDDLYDENQRRLHNLRSSIRRRTSNRELHSSINSGDSDNEPDFLESHSRGLSIDSLARRQHSFIERRSLSLLSVEDEDEPSEQTQPSKPNDLHGVVSLMSSIKEKKPLEIEDIEMQQELDELRARKNYRYKLPFLQYFRDRRCMAALIIAVAVLLTIIFASLGSKKSDLDLARVTPKEGDLSHRSDGNFAGANRAGSGGDPSPSSGGSASASGASIPFIAATNAPSPEPTFVLTTEETEEATIPLTDSPTPEPSYLVTTDETEPLEFKPPTREPAYLMIGEEFVPTPAPSYLVTTDETEPLEFKPPTREPAYLMIEEEFVPTPAPSYLVTTDETEPAQNKPPTQEPSYIVLEEMSDSPTPAPSYLVTEEVTDSPRLLDGLIAQHEPEPHVEMKDGVILAHEPTPAPSSWGYKT